MVIPDDKRISTSIDILNLLPCYLSHKIGVVYIGKHQGHDERAILANGHGSSRYRTFVNSLGNLVPLRDLDTSRFYAGSLATDGSPLVRRHCAGGLPRGHHDAHGKRRPVV